MSEVKEASKVGAAGTAKPMHVFIIGKVERVRRYEQFTYTTVICPAPDLYSKPQVLELRSKARFAEREEEVKVWGRLGGWQGKPYKVTDKETGEIRQLVPVTLFLDLIED